MNDAKSKALGKKSGVLGQHSWLDKHVEAQKKSQGGLYNYIRSGSHLSEIGEVEASKKMNGTPKGKTRSFKNRESNLHKYLTSGH